MVDVADTFLVDGRRVGPEECRRLFDAPLPERMRRVFARVHGPRLLDVGSYDGGFVAALTSARPDIEAWGAEYDSENLRIARFLHPELTDRFVSASAYELPFEEGSFDCVTFQEVIEHLEGAAQAVKELNRILRPGGRLLVTTPNAYFWRHFLSQARTDLVNRLRRRPPSLASLVFFAASEWNRHIYCWTPATLLTLLEVNGFRYTWHGYSDTERGLTGRALMKIAPFVGPELVLEAEKVSDAPGRLV
jgi:SAM-dependent methyltransferase